MVPRLVQTNTLEFGILEQGTGPLALCLHGFPDSAPSWRHLLPALADAGFHAVAPFMRGYAPSAIPDDGCYRSGALVADVVNTAIARPPRVETIVHDHRNGDATPPSPSSIQNTLCVDAPAPALASQARLSLSSSACSTLLTLASVREGAC